jgi:hypothetical protein
MALTDAQRLRIMDMVRAGRGRNEIAREIGVSGGTISRVASKAGLTFDRTETRRATDARSADAKARRTVLSLAMLGDLEDARLRLAEMVGARDFQLTAQGIDLLARAYVNLHKLEPDDNGLGEAKGMVASMLLAIRTSVDGIDRMNAVLEPVE